MSAPNAARDAQPGWRGTDPKGGTWVLACHQDHLPWCEIAADGRVHWRSQEEAEQANLVRLLPENAVKYVDCMFINQWGEWASDDLVNLFQAIGVQPGDGIQEAIQHVREFFSTPAPLEVDELAQVIREVDGNHSLGAGALAGAIVERLGAAAPAPLDPGNPDDLPEFDWKNAAHLRWLADAACAAPLPVWDQNDAAGEAEADAVDSFARHWREEADRLDAERAEQAQDEADRKAAEEYASSLRASSGPKWHDAREDFLAGIRAERARVAGGAS